MHAKILEAQNEVCISAGAEVGSCRADDKVGISQSALDGDLPINGMRHPAGNETTGWYIWGGEQFSEDDDFFLPLHSAHLETRCPLVLKFLLLPPGWRFLTDGSYEDVWFDANLLDVD